MIKKPTRRGLTPKYYSLSQFMIISLGLMMIPLMSYIPRKLRMKILFWGHKYVRGE